MSERSHPTGSAACGSLLALAGLTAFACSFPVPAAGSASQDVISPAAAAQVVRDYWAVNERGAVSQDVSVFAQVQTGALLDADRGVTQANRALGFPGLTSARPLRRVTTFVPHQTGYPAQFLALLETVGADVGGRLTSQPVAFYDHFIRPSVKDRWKADFYVTVDLSRGIKLAVDRDGYATAVAQSSTKYVVRPDQLATALIDYWQSGLTTGSPIGPFAPGNLTTNSVRSLRDHASTMSSLGYRTETRFLARPFVQAYQAADGDAVVIFVFEASEVVTPAGPGGCILQPAERLQRWGGLVPAGGYTSVATDTLVEVIAKDPVAAPHAQVDVLSGVQNDIAARTGQPVPGCHD